MSHMFKSDKQWPEILFGGLCEIFDGIGPNLTGINNTEKHLEKWHPSENIQRSVLGLKNNWVSIMWLLLLDEAFRG